MRPIRPAPKAIIVENGKLLMLQMQDGEGFWYLFPGGGLNFGETLHDGLRRECREELGVEVEIGRLRFVRDYISRNHEFAHEDPDAHQVEYMFDCRIVNPDALGSGTDHDKGQLGLAWLPIERLMEYRLYPKQLRTLVGRMDAGTAPCYLGDVN